MNQPLNQPQKSTTSERTLKWAKAKSDVPQATDGFPNGHGYYCMVRRCHHRHGHAPQIERPPAVQPAQWRAPLVSLSNLRRLRIPQLEQGQDRSLIKEQQWLVFVN